MISNRENKDFCSCVQGAWENINSDLSNGICKVRNKEQEEQKGPQKHTTSSQTHMNNW